MYDQVSSGVVRLDTVGCSGGGGTGTGFLIAPDLVATVAHVVEGDPLVRVSDPVLERSMSGTVIGVDHDHDVALVRLPAPLAGHVFKLSSAQPGMATDMAAIGFPLGGGEQVTFGHVTGVHTHRLVGSGSSALSLSDAALSDAALNHGNSGGPWLAMDGTVIALDESGPPEDQDNQRAEGNNGGVPAVDAAPFLTQWSASSSPPAATPCTDQLDAYTAAQQASLTLWQYFVDLDASDYASAFAQLDPQHHPAAGVAAFTTKVESSQDFDATKGSQLFDWVGESTVQGEPVLDVRFRSTQDASLGPDGEPCTDWTLRYRFEQVDGLWLIRSSEATPGTPGHTPCPAQTSPTASAPANQPVASSTPAATTAVTPASNGFRTYTNARFGFSTQVPAAFIPGQPPENGDGLSFNSTDGRATLTVFGGNNVLNDTATTLRTKLAADLVAKGGSVSYRNTSTDIAAVSGTYPSSLGTMVFYERSAVGPGSIDTILWSYPVADKPADDPLLYKAVGTFRPGDLTTGH
ncbi:hypothetical protein acdb102_42530 [Acidothermaceae bacterium B102]|nr:hypothetical protein acdb102_42530 [Acidothermaceae bacterium B102]